MKKPLLFLAALALLGSCSVGDETPSAADSQLSTVVDPLIGTDGPGNVYPGAQAPFGMVQLSPDNGTGGWDRIAGYFYADSTIAGFSHTHLSGTGAGDLYDILFTPAVAPYSIAQGELGLHSKFLHDREYVTAGFYSVLLEDYDIHVQLTATERVGAQSYTFNRGSDSALVKVTLSKAMNWDYTTGSRIEVVDSVTICGYRTSSGWAPRQEVYFYTRFSKPFVRSVIDTSYTRHHQERYNNLELQDGYFYFDVKDGESVEVYTALSGVSTEGARGNLMAEASGKDFSAILAETQSKWDGELSKIQIEGATEAQRTTFYTSLYRTMIAPVIFSDVDGQYMGVDRQIHQSPSTRYTTFSLWDTYRAEHPLLVMLDGDRVKDMVRSMVDFYHESGALPVWNMWGNETDMMIGNHAIPVIVEAYLKGIEMDDKEAFEAILGSSNRDQRGQKELRERGYISADGAENESVSKTLEYAYDDYCVSVMAAALDKKYPGEGYDKYAQEFELRGKAYRNLFNPDSEFFEPRNADGSWVGRFDPGEYTDHYTESNAWHYLFLQHNVWDQIELVGGSSVFEGSLDNFFLVSPDSRYELPIFSTGMIGQYAHGNEPSHHVAYLYNRVGRRDKSMKYVDSIRNSLYSDQPDGICGNEDCGQMSAWYVFSSLGFYPVDPVSMVYELGSPLFEKATVELSTGKKLTIIRHDDGLGEVTLNGKVLSDNQISWDQLKEGGELIFN
ncbi:MAG: GH92 family glycosyl hydrolase [Rikenellaceae bacterium]